MLYDASKKRLKCRIYRPFKRSAYGDGGKCNAMTGHDRVSLFLLYGATDCDRPRQEMLYICYTQ